MEEVQDWVTYANKRGTLNLGLRIEAGFALVAHMLARGFKLTKEGNQPATMKDFMPHIGEPQEDADISFEDAIKAFHKIGTTGTPR